MDKLGQTWQTIKGYRKSYLVIPCLFAIVSLIIRFGTEGREVAMSEVVSWVKWILIPASIGLIAVFLWHYFRNPYVEVKAKVIQIRTYDYYARILGMGADEGDKEMTIDVTLIPSKPVKVSNILLKLSGKCFDAKEFSPIAGGMIPFSIREIKNTESCMLFFDIPKGFAVNSDNARIFAIANNIKRFSKPLAIDFGGCKNDRKETDKEIY